MTEGFSASSVILITLKCRYDLRRSSRPFPLIKGIHRRAIVQLFVK